VRVLYITLLAAVALPGQQPQHSQVIAAGTPVTRITLTLSQPPAVSDGFDVYISTQNVKAALVSPDGRRITETTSDHSLLRWRTPIGGLIPPVGSSDGGQTINIDFVAAGLPGRYVFEFDARAATAQTNVSVNFQSGANRHDSLMHSVRGFQRVGPVALNANHLSASLDINVAATINAALIDILCDPSASVSFTLPGGRVIDTPAGIGDGFTWKTVPDVSALDDQASLIPISMSALLLPGQGTHHLFSFERAAAGRYQVRARVPQSGNLANSGNLTAALIPLGEVMNKIAREMEESFKPRSSGPTHMRIFGLPLQESLVGAPFEIQVDFVGEPVVDAPTFRVLMEYREKKEDQPRLETPTVQFTRTSEGRYIAHVTPTHAGILRVGIRATGKNVKGESFSEEGVTEDVYVKATVARVFPGPPIR
jgi:hypothetical protein